MRDLSLHILDLTQNSVRANATLVQLDITVDERKWITIRITDDGCGMDAELKERVLSPFATTRTTRKVGLGLPLLRMTAEQTGGTLTIESQVGAGTTVTAGFHTDHIDCPPLGDLGGTVSLLIQGAPDVEWTWKHTTPRGSYFLDTRQLREILGPDVPLSEPSVTLWIREYLQEQEAAIQTETIHRK